MKSKLLTILVFWGFIAASQTPKYRVISIPVQRNGITLRDPWVGGMDCPQFSTCDLNQDGVQDLFVFDRAANRVITYLGNGGSVDTMFTYAPQYESLFPSGLNNWVLLRDYNKDGFPDIFTHTTAGTLVMKGSLQFGNLHFDTVARYLTYISGGFKPNIYTGISDIPILTDVNGDGDMDLMTYDVNGGSISYYENQSVENGGVGAYAYDSLPFYLITTCWGNVAQNSQSNSMVLHIDTAASDCQYYVGATGPGSGGGNSRHAGNSIYSIIDPAYGDVDVLNGNVGYNDLFLLRNCTYRNYPLGNVCQWDSIFPPVGTSMLMPSYPAAYGYDVNNDGKDDILMAPNGYPPYDNATLPSRNVHNVMYFNNTGDATTWYTYQSDSFLVHHMLDFGTNSRGVFYDFDGDGLTDIIVGNYGYYNEAVSGSYQSAMAYYRNTGTSTGPQFTEVTLDYDSMSNYGLLNMSPAFGDLDGDGHPDLLMGDKSGYLSFFKNMATTGSSYPVMTTTHYGGIHETAYSAPYIYDVNGDSLPDLLVGNDNGQVSYYWNYGTKTSPMFSPDSSNLMFGGVNVCPYQYINGCFSQPFVVKDNTGNLKLFVGSARGIIFAFDIDQSKLRAGNFNLIDSNYLHCSTGLNSTIAVADLNNDGLPEYLVGNSLGGLLMFSDSLWDSSTVLGTSDVPCLMGGMRIYPDPAKDYFVCVPPTSWAELTGIKTDVYNVLGEKMITETGIYDGQVKINTQAFSNGVYIVRLWQNQNSCTAKVLISH